MTELLGIPFSPWSEKARWALQARGVPYREVTYAPLLGEPFLRAKLGKWRGVVTVPVLTDDEGHTLGDSAEIAAWADERGAGPRLFPAELRGKIEEWVALSERGLGAGRGLSLAQVLEDQEALGEMVPPPLRKPLGKMGRRVAALGIRRTMRKYGVARTDTGTLERELAAVLDELRAALARAPAGTPRTILGTFTFADVAMAQVLAFVEPPKFGLRIGRASRRAFTNAAFRERYKDLLEWRDALYEAYRPR
jgi:glutathione S-transferase